MFTPLAFNKESIVTRGLVFHVDAADRTSYSPGSGVWNDLTGNGNNGTLVNGPTYDSGNGGSISFDGADDYVSISNFNEDSNASLSIFCWCNLHSFDTYLSSNYGFIATKRDNSNDKQWQILYIDGNFRASIYDGPNFIVSTTNPTATWNLNEWVYVGFTTVGTNGGNISTYFNGVLDDSSTLTANRKTGSRNLILANTSWNLGFLVADIDISNIKIYNRALTPSEITQNYNALKGRFGL